MARKTTSGGGRKQSRVIRPQTSGASGASIYVRGATPTDQMETIARYSRHTRRDPVTGRNFSVVGGSVNSDYQSTPQYLERVRDAARSSSNRPGVLGRQGGPAYRGRPRPSRSR